MIVGIIWTLIGAILLGFYNGLLLQDDKTQENDPLNTSIEDKWHIVGAILFIYLAATGWNMYGIVYVPFILSSFWLIYAGIVHKIALKKGVFYVGTKAFTDRFLRKISSKNPELVSAILKLIAFIGSLILLLSCANSD